jgi:ubiquinone biosynthesis protein UbiJ
MAGCAGADQGALGRETTIVGDPWQLRGAVARHEGVPAASAAYNRKSFTNAAVARPGLARPGAFDAPFMFDALQRQLLPAAVDRATLLANHVIAAEPEAQRRLQAHAGRCVAVRLDGLPGWLPALPVLAFVVTPAGLLEWQPDHARPDLQLAADVTDAPEGLRRLLAGEAPRVTLDGDAALAADVGWLMQNLRWDLAADLERLLPAGVVQPLLLAGRSIRSALQRVVATVRPPGGSGR